MAGNTKVITMTDQVLGSNSPDKLFLKWIHQRMACRHGENSWYDYMNKLRCIIATISEDQVTPNIENNDTY